jgi:hypothetical protein
MEIMHKAVVTSEQTRPDGGPTKPVHAIPQHSRKRRLLSFVWVLLALMLSIGSWSLATPLTQGPDEPDHMIQAAAVVRGQFGGTQSEEHWNGIPIGEVGAVEVPKWVLQFPNVSDLISICTTAPQSCQFVKHPPTGGSDTAAVLSGTQFSRFPPLYYLIVGLPSLLGTGGGAQWGMRFTGVLLDSVLLALGLFLLARYHPRRLPLLAAMVALSPMVLFLTSVVSSSGIEIAAGFAAWCGGLCVVERARIPPMLAVLTGLSFVALILSRPISLYNAAVIVIALALFLGWTGSRELLRKRSFRPTLVLAIASAVLAGSYLLVVGEPYLEGTPKTPPLDLIGSISLTLHLTGSRLLQCVGDFGWVAIPAPRWVQVLWIMVLAGLLAYGLAVSRRVRRALPFILLAIVVMPVIFESPRIDSVGNYWSGRYWLPLAVGLPLLASGIELHPTCKRARAAVSASQQLAGFIGVGVLLIAAQIGSLVVALYDWVGSNKVLGTHEWSPLIAPPIVIALLIAGQILLLGFLTWNFLDKERIPVFLATGGRRPKPALGNDRGLITPEGSASS